MARIDGDLRKLRHGAVDSERLIGACLRHAFGDTREDVFAHADGIHEVNQIGDLLEVGDYISRQRFAVVQRGNGLVDNRLHVPDLRSVEVIRDGIRSGLSIPAVHPAAEIEERIHLTIDAGQVFVQALDVRQGINNEFFNDGNPLDADLVDAVITRMLLLEGRTLDEAVLQQERERMIYGVLKKILRVKK